MGSFVDSSSAEKRDKSGRPDFSAPSPELRELHMLPSELMRLQTRSRSPALKDGRSLVEKRLDALFEVVAKKCHSPQRLDLEKFWPRTCDWERSVVCDVCGRLGDISGKRKLTSQFSYLPQTKVRG